MVTNDGLISSLRGQQTFAHMIKPAHEMGLSTDPCSGRVGVAGGRSGHIGVSWQSSAGAQDWKSRGAASHDGGALAELSWGWEGKQAWL